MFNEQQIPLNMMSCYPTLPLDWKVLPSATGAQQERWKRFWTKSDTLVTAANHLFSAFLTRHPHSQTAVLISLRLLALESWRNLNVVSNKKDRSNKEVLK